jgi:hypothetical protein
MTDSLIFRNTFRASLACAILVASTVHAATLPAPSTSVTLPAPSANSYAIAAAFGPSDGLLYVWNGAQVLKQNAIDSSSFTSIGNVGSGSADAGPMAFSRDASRILVGNGAGGFVGGANSGLVFGIPASGGSSNVPIADAEFHNSFLAAPLGASNDKFFINSGNVSFTASSVSVLDQLTGTNVPVIENIPGASTSMAVGGGRLYVGVGFGPSRGELRSFAIPALDTAYTNTSPIDWTSGQLFNSVDNNSGAGMFIDARGFLFVGGPDGVTVFDTSGNARLYDNQGFTIVDYDPTQDRFLVTGFGSEQGIYPAAAFLVPEPGAGTLALLLGMCVAPLVRRGRRTRRRRPEFQPTS